MCNHCPPTPLCRCVEGMPSTIQVANFDAGPLEFEAGQWEFSAGLLEFGAGPLEFEG